VFFIKANKFSTNHNLLPLGSWQQISLQKSKIIFPNPKGVILDFRKHKRSLKVEMMQIICDKNI